jgi:acetyl esterase/lipase
MPRPFLARSVMILALAFSSAAPAMAAPADLEKIELPVAGVAARGPELIGPQPFGGPGRVVRNVVQPSLSVFAPPAGKATGAALIIAPGGGFQFLSIDNEGEALARWLAERGVTAFVLRYRTATTPADPDAFKQQVLKLFRPGAISPQALDELGAAAALDGRAAVRAVRSQAAQRGLDPQRIGLIGFSAGGWVALSAASAVLPDERPDIVAAIYPARPGALAVGSQTPPLFLAAAADDPLLKVDGQIELYQAWRAARRPAELHLYPRGGHGFGVNHQSLASDHWIDAFADWLAGQGWLRPRI